MGCVPARRAAKAEPRPRSCAGGTKVASWSIPDAALPVSELRHAITGKRLKTALRERYGGYYLRGG